MGAVSGEEHRLGSAATNKISMATVSTMSVLVVVPGKPVSVLPTRRSSSCSVPCLVAIVAHRPHCPAEGVALM